MTHFEVVRRVMDEHFAAILQSAGGDESVAYARIKAAICTLSDSYRTGQGRNYGDLLQRFGYLLRQTAVNANLCETLLCRRSSIRTYVHQLVENCGIVSVCAIGGGPGTELMAIVKWLSREYLSMELESPVFVDFSLADVCTEWEDCQELVVNSLRTVLDEEHDGNTPITIQMNAIRHDLTTGQWLTPPTLPAQHDIYIMNYAISELPQYRREVAATLASVVESAPIGSRFLIIDRNENSIARYAAWAAEQAGLSSITTTKTEETVNSDEQSDLLQRYIQATGEWPRLRWRAFCVYAVKA